MSLLSDDSPDVPLIILLRSFAWVNEESRGARAQQNLLPGAALAGVDLGLLCAARPADARPLFAWPRSPAWHMAAFSHHRLRVARNRRTPARSRDATLCYSLWRTSAESLVSRSLLHRCLDRSAGSVHSEFSWASAGGDQRALDAARTVPVVVLSAGAGGGTSRRARHLAADSPLYSR